MLKNFVDFPASEHITHIPNNTIWITACVFAGSIVYFARPPLLHLHYIHHYTQCPNTAGIHVVKILWLEVLYNLASNTIYMMCFFRRITKGCIKMK